MRYSEGLAITGVSNLVHVWRHQETKTNEGSRIVYNREKLTNMHRTRLLGYSPQPACSCWPASGDIRRKYSDKLKQPVLELIGTFLSSDINSALIDNLFENLTQVILRISEKLPHSSFKKNLKPFWNVELTELKRRKVLAYRVWVDTGRPRAPEDYRFRNYKSTKKEFMQALTRLSKQYENEEVLNAVRFCRGRSQ